MTVGSRLVVLASGEGTTLQALLQSPLRDRIAAVGSDVPGCPALKRALDAGIETFAVAPGDFATRSDWDQALLAHLIERRPSWIATAGFMRILGPDVVHAFRLRIINIHPSLLPAFPGAHAVRDALQAGVRITGCTVHFVDEGVDTGPIIAQEAVDVRPGDTVESLHHRIKGQERSLLIEVLTELTSSARSTGDDMNPGSEG